ncbi:MAG: hypothetical protein BAJALOKI1v1_130031 [Promethearchaeota archaeon]|nr:MAG: hypothetical protein BAJALOKI1v1_130031 [Candidatus Lokiarchaeota archaeon]
MGCQECGVFIKHIIYYTLFSMNFESIPLKEWELKGLWRLKDSYLSF